MAQPANGYVPASALVEVEPGLYLETATAAAYKKAKAASGGTLNIARPGGAYRTWQMQYDMKHGIPSYAYWNLNPNSTAGLANPGQSTHGYGIAVDIIGNNNWMLAHGGDYGFTRPFGNNDPNHWKFSSPTWAGVVVLTPTQRQVKPEGPEVLRRATPDTSQPDLDPDLQPGEVGNFDGWIHGQNVGGNDVWFRGISGNWFWSGGFTDTGTHDLADLNPVVVPPVTGMRTVLATIPVRYRNASNTGATELGVYPAGSEQTFAYWQTGEGVNGNNVWYVTADKANFSWSGGYTSTSKDGLTELVATTPPPTTVWPSTPYTFTKAGDFVTRVEPAHWSNFENQYSVPDATKRKGFPALPTSVVNHQWGAQGAYLISSVINTFKAVHNNADDRVSAHFVVNADEIVQMVSLSDRAYHAGADGNGFVGIEIDPFISETVNGELTDRAKKIIANVRKVLIFLGQRNANVALTNLQHRNVPNTTTSCGSFIQPIEPLLNVQPVLTPPDVDPDPNPDPIPDYSAQLAALEQQIASLQDTVNHLSQHLGAAD